MRFFADLRFVIKGVELGGAAAHIEEDDAVGAGAEARWARGEIGWGCLRRR